MNGRNAAMRDASGLMALPLSELAVDQVSLALPLYQMPLDRYHEIARLGILTTNDRVELLEGCLVEVSSPTHAANRHFKHRVYARARIPVYWIVNLPEARIEVYTKPQGGKNPAYRERRDYGRNDAVPLMIEEKAVGNLSVRAL